MSRHPKPPRRPTKPEPDRRPPAAFGTNGLYKSYGDEAAGDALALSPLTTRVEVGERVALLGHNGSGKTTLIRMAVGLLEPSGGTATIFGAPAGSSTAREKTAFISDSPTFYDDLSLWEHIEYVSRLHGVSEWGELGAHILDHLGLLHRADDLPNRFSRGLRQKAAIALAFVRPFDVLFVDEPFVGLDAAGKEALIALIDQAHVDGATVIVATHELSFADRVDRVIALRDGKVIHDGSASPSDVDELVRVDREAAESDAGGE